MVYLFPLFVRFKYFLNSLKLPGCKQPEYTIKASLFFFFLSLTNFLRLP